METNTEVVQYKDLSEFLSKHVTKTNEQYTHTRIPDKTLNIYPGSYHISDKELSLFYKLYYQHVFIKKKPEYLTEKQIENGPLLVDLDFHYNHSVTTRQHTEEHITDLISSIYLELLKDFYVFKEGDTFIIHVMEKPNVNRLKDGSMTKDGIHLNFCLQVDHIMQQIIRERVMERIPELWDLPLINSWDKVLDEGISKGCTNWQLLGSRKPENETYEIKYSYKLTYCDDDEFTMEDVKETISLKDNFEVFSAQYTQHPKFEISSKIKEEYERRKNVKNNLKAKKGCARIIPKKTNNFSNNQDDDYDDISLEDIKTKEILEKEMNKILSKFTQSEHELKILHEYTQILPEKYYEPGSHELNRKVAFALKQTDERLFLSWIMLRSKASDFDYDTIPDLYTKWKKYFKIKPDGITKQSIMFWAKMDAPAEFEKIKKSNISHYVDETLISPTDYDFAYVLLLMFKDKFVCTELGNGSSGAVWYRYSNHHWTLDRGQKLRQAISEEMYNMYSSKMQKQMEGMQEFEPSDERYMQMQKKGIKMSEVINRLKKTSDKNNIMREASVLFYNYNEEFVKKMDTNKYLMGHSNGVVDFKNGIFRDGMPEDCITKSTGIPYVDLTDLTKVSKEHLQYMKDINECLDQIFPVAELRNYTFDHLASTLIGENLNQTFNIYYGSGRNGKSVLTDLMSKTLGEYKGTIPISLITEKRAGVGGLSPEIAMLKGVRYAVLQEPSKAMKLNEGFMKELTGGDAVTARTLYRESETYIPQYDVVVCANNLFEISSNDDGTWRRIRVIKFLSKFLYESEWNDPKFSDCKYKFPRDDNLKNNYEEWAPVFAGMLTKRAFETKGIVRDCAMVTEECNIYRNGQDHISAFINEKIQRMPGKLLKKKEVYDEFKNWFELQQGSNKKPKGVELYEYIDMKFGKCQNDGWRNIGIIYQDTDEIDDMCNA